MKKEEVREKAAKKAYRERNREGEETKEVEPQESSTVSAQQA